MTAIDRLVRCKQNVGWAEGVEDVIRVCNEIQSGTGTISFARLLNRVSRMIDEKQAAYDREKEQCSDSQPEDSSVPSASKAPPC